jgi:hypothetical protein
VPEKSNRVLTRVRMIRDGRLNDSTFGSRMTGHGGYAHFMHELIHALAAKYKLDRPRHFLRTDLFRRPGELF